MCCSKGSGMKVRVLPLEHLPGERPDELGGCSGKHFLGGMQELGMDGGENLVWISRISASTAWGFHGILGG